MRTEPEIRRISERANLSTHRPTRAHDATFEEGIAMALEWILENDDDFDSELQGEIEKATEE